MKKHRMLRFERLEDRSMLAGTVTAIQFGPPSPFPTLYIQGDDADNKIVIRQIGSTSYGTIIVKVQGINTKIYGGVSFESYNPRRLGTTFTFEVMDFQIYLGGGNDSLRINDLNVPLFLTVDMGAGNDTLKMSNVHQIATNLFENPFDSTITLGNGNDVAVFNNMSSAGNIAISAGTGRDLVSLAHVTAGDQLSVDMGSGSFDHLSVARCAANEASLTASGINGSLIRQRNRFTHAADVGLHHAIAAIFSL